MSFSVSYIYEIVDRYSSKIKRISNATKDVGKSLEKASQKAGVLGSKLRDVGRGMLKRVTLPIVAAGGAMIKYASDMQETQSKVGAVFKDSTKSVKDWSKTSLKSMGLAQQTALDSAALFGGMATGMGLSIEEGAKMSMSLTKLSADASSFYDVSQDISKTALAGVFTGETEALKKFGVVMTETNLKQFMLDNGIKGNIKNLSQAEKVGLRYSFVMETMRDANGDFARTAQSASNQTRTLKEGSKQLAASFGTIILPIYTKVINKLNEWMNKLQLLSPEMKNTIVVVLAVIAVLAPLLIVIGSIATAIGALGGFIGIWVALKSGVMLFAKALLFLVDTPLGLIITGVAIAIYQFHKLVDMAGSVELAFMAIGVGVKSMFVNALAWLGNNFIKPILGYINKVIYAANKMGASISAIDVPDFNAIAADTIDADIERLSRARDAHAAKSQSNINNNNIDIKIDNKGAAPKATASSGGSGNLGLTVAGAAG